MLQRQDSGLIKEREGDIAQWHVFGEGTMRLVKPDFQASNTPKAIPVAMTYTRGLKTRERG